MKIRFGHVRRVLVTALAAGLPAVIVTMALLLGECHLPRERWTLGLLVCGVWLALCFSVRNRVAGPLRTLASLLEALREGD